MNKKRLTVKEMHKLIKSGKVKLRSMQYIESLAIRGYNKNYIRDWFNFEYFEKSEEPEKGK